MNDEDTNDWRWHPLPVEGESLTVHTWLAGHPPPVWDLTVGAVSDTFDNPGDTSKWGLLDHGADPIVVQRWLPGDPVFVQRIGVDGAPIGEPFEVAATAGKLHIPDSMIEPGEDDGPVWAIQWHPELGPSIFNWWFGLDVPVFYIEYRLALPWGHTETVAQQRALIEAIWPQWVRDRVREITHYLGVGTDGADALLAALGLEIPK